MTNYATKNDIVGLYGPTLLDLIADRDNDGRAEDVVVAAALTSATEEINGFISQRYVLPIDPPPPMFKQFCIDMAVYRMTPLDDARTEEMRKRYDDCIKRLTMIANGDLGLGLPEDEEPVPGGVALTAGTMEWDRS